MRGGAFEHVGDGFDTAMRMVREAAQGTFEGIVEGEVIEEQEGIGLVADARGYGAKQTHARAFDGGLWFDNLGDSSKIIHVGLDEAGWESITKSRNLHSQLCQYSCQSTSLHGLFVVVRNLVSCHTKGEYAFRQFERFSCWGQRYRHTERI